MNGLHIIANGSPHPSIIPKGSTDSNADASIAMMLSVRLMKRLVCTEILLIFACFARRLYEKFGFKPKTQAQVGYQLSLV